MFLDFSVHFQPANLFFNPVSKSVFFIKLLTSGIVFPTAVNAEVVAKPLMLRIFPSTSVILPSTSLKSVLPVHFSQHYLA